MDDLIRQFIDIIRGMWRRRWIGVGVAWGVALVGGIAVSRVPERYEASARIYVDTQSLLKPLMSGLAVQPDVDQQVAMMARTLITRPNMERLVLGADLDLKATTQEQKDRLIDVLLRTIRFSSSGRDNVYDVIFRDEDPAHAKLVVQKLVSMFVESGLGNKRRDTESAQKFIDEQISSYEKRLEEAEGRLKDFRLRNFAVTATGGQDFISRMTTVAEELSKVRLELRVAEQSRDALKRELAGEEPILLPDGPAAAVSQVPDLDGRIDTQRRQLDELLRRYTDEHPDVQSTRRMISQLEEQKRQELEARRKAAAVRNQGRISPATNPVFQQIKISLAEAEASVAALRARSGELQHRLDQLRGSANRIPQVEAELAQLNRDYDVLKQSYQALVSRRESAALTGEVDSSAGLAEFRIIDPPRVSSKPVFPNRVSLIGLVLAVALGAGAAACFAWTQLFPTIHTAHALREVVQRPVLGVISVRPSATLSRQRRDALLAFGGAIGGLVLIYGAWLGWLTLGGRS